MAQTDPSPVDPTGVIVDAVSQGEPDTYEVGGFQLAGSSSSI